MKAVGIVAEYNPFHNGHAYHIKKAKEQTGADTVVCVMSGNFVQRGGAAIADKWTRARMALSGGADLILELPCYFALNTAELFAYGAVATLDALGCVKFLCFGSEHADLAGLKKAARVLSCESEKFSHSVKEKLSAGEGFPSARAAVLEEVFNIQGWLIRQPNNILAIEYLKSLYRLDSDMEPVIVQRYKAGYHDLTPYGNIASASAIRQMLKKGDDILKYLPKKAADIWQKAVQDGIAPVWEDSFDNAVLSHLRFLGAENLRCIHDVAEGLEYRIFDAAASSASIAEVVDAAVSKRYTRARISRIVWSAFLGIKKQYYPPSPTYIRVLGLSENGKRLLATAKKTAKLPVIVKLANYEKKQDRLLQLDLLATDLYSLGYPNKDKRIGRLDYKTSPVVVE